MVLIILIAVYFVGYFVAYWMNKVELESERHVYTKGAALINVLVSFLSWFFVIYLLISTWFLKVNKTGYWNLPFNPIAETKETKE